MPDASKPIRSFLKGLSWELCALLLTILIAYGFLGAWGTSIEFAMVCFVVKIFFFYCHERIWHRFSWGKR